MLKRTLLLAATVLIFWPLGFYSDLFAEVIKLKSGREISGTLIDITDTDVILFASGGKIWFGRNKVESINGLTVEEMQRSLNTAKDAYVKDTKGQMASSFKEGLTYIETVRKLKFKSEPSVEVLSRQALKDRLKAATEKYVSEEDLDKRGKLLLKLGLIDDAAEYKRTALDIFSESAAGFYSPDDKKIFVDDDALKDATPGMPSMTLMHEQVHALQDENFDLKKIQDTEKLKDNEDESLAVQSVVEGEATVLMFDASLRSFKSWGIGAAGGKDFDIRSFVMESMLAASKHHKNKGGKNAVFVEDLLFPYVWGGVFIQHIVNTRGWEAVNTFYSDLPVSSEQIMHPEKYYISRDLPRKVNIPDISKSLNPQRTLLLKNTLGEFGFYLVGKNFLDELSVKVMSEGWAGDTYELYEDTQSKKLLFVSLAEWDSEGHASEMFSFYRDILKKKYPDLSVVKESANAAQYKSGNECIYLARWQDKVLIIEGAEEQELQLLIGAFNLYE